MLRDDNRAALHLLQELQSGHDTLLAEIRAGRSVPAVTPTVTKSKPELEEITDQRRNFFDSKTGLTHTLLLFRSKNVLPLRDIKIDVTFEKPVDSVAFHLQGAFVIEQGTHRPIDGPTHYVYETDYLSQSNDIVMEVLSKGPIVVASMTLSP